MIKAYGKDIIRTISKEKKRFVAISVITVLGVAMFSGLKASCEDLRISADAFYDSANLHDLKVVSTLGLDDDDIKALSDIDEVELADGGYSESVTAIAGDKSTNAVVKTISKNDYDMPTLISGSMPEKEGEAGVTKEFLDELGISVGDYVEVEIVEDSSGDSDNGDDSSDNSDSGNDTDDKEDDENGLTVFEFKIVGTIIDPSNVTNPDGTTAFRSGTTEDLPIFVTWDSVNSDVYTYINIKVKDAEELLCYSKEYENKIQSVKAYIEDNVKSEREKERYDKVYGEAMEEYEDAKADALDELYDAKKKLIDAEEEYRKGKRELEDAYEELTKNSDTLESNKTALKNQKSELEKNKTELENAIADLTAAEPLYAMNIDYYLATLGELNAKLEAVVQGLATIATSETKLETAEKELEEGWTTYNDSVAELEDALKEINDGWNDYYKGKAEADEELADALDEINDIEYPTWYVQNRNSLTSYKNVGSDADSIEAIGTVFPIVFLIVAILISLTTVTRMVDEDRGLIGVYKALGFTDREIRRKYEVYSVSACVSGAIIGTVFAFLVLPAFICFIFTTMYLFPEYLYTFVPAFGIAGPFVFVAGILFATVRACESELSMTPALLMRPKAPKAGSRVLLERITFIWGRMSFLNKVTARNLFRYKKRMLMTIVGIGGCMALLLFGFSIKDSVTDLMPRQYENTFKYDLMLVGNSDDDKKLKSYLDGNEYVENYIDAEISSVTVKADIESEDVTDSDKADNEKNGTATNSKKSDNEMSFQIIVVEDGEELGEYINFETPENEARTLNDGEVFITQNAANVLGLEVGDKVNAQLINLKQAEVGITAVVKNYLSNYLYMNRATYEELFETYKPNGMLVNFSEKCTDQIKYSKELSKKDGVLTCLSTEDLMEEFSGAFKLINMVVYVVIVMSAALAFVVLFTLSTTNISERERELATIKVLGFFDYEVHQYVDKETLILTAIGIALGIPLGRAFASTLTVILNLPAIYLEVSLHSISYLFAAGLTIFFALLVNFITDKTLDRIDPVGALKAVE
ncbi:MAG: hypothetical protein K6F37_05090 [Lachnospiraceae bacterium]|nr:hypothetical protein [Lachnospiraceae bacterium]